MRWYKLALPIIIVVLLLAGVRAVGNPGCSGHLRHDAEVKLNGKTIKVQTAMSDEDVVKGLSGISCIGQHEGMLFVFDQPAYYEFWAKDMQFAFDVVWLSEDKKVVTIFDYVQPSSYPEKYLNYQPAKYVLELPAGQADSLHLSEGQQLNF